MENVTKRCEESAPLLSQLLPEKITPQQREQLSRALGNWNYCAYFLSNDVSTQDVGALLALEIAGDKRQHMIRRLVGKLTTLYREQILKEISSVIEEFEGR